MKRPFGLLLTTVLLGLGAFSLIASGAATCFAGLNRPAPPPGAPFSPATAESVLLFTGLLELLLAVWPILTLIGLLRLRSWARWSVQILGTLLVLFGGFSALAVLALPRVAGNPAGMPHALLVALALFFLALVVVGASWLVYFSLASVRAFFLPLYSVHDLPSAPWSAAQSLATPGGLPAPTPPPPAAALLPRGRFAHVPAPVAVIACLLYFGTASCFLLAFLPFPASALGLVVAGRAAHIFYGVFSIVLAFIATGLLRLRNAARLAALCLAALGIVNVLLTLTPRYRAQSAAYQAVVRESIHLPAPPPTLPVLNPASLSVILPGVFFGLFVYGLAAWALHLHRNSFSPRD